MQEQPADWLDGRLASDPAWVGGDDVVVIDALVAQEGQEVDAPAAAEPPAEVELSPSWLDDAALDDVDAVDGVEAIVVSDADVAEALVLLAEVPPSGADVGTWVGLDDALVDGDAVVASADTPDATIDPFDVFLATNPVDADLDDVDVAGVGDSLVGEIDTNDVAPTGLPAVETSSLDESAGRRAADHVDAGASTGQTPPDPPSDESWSPSPTTSLDAFDQLGFDQVSHDAGDAFAAGHHDDAADHPTGDGLGDDDHADDDLGGGL